MEANFAMYHYDVMINIGARFDDRVTGKLWLLAQLFQNPCRY